MDLLEIEKAERILRRLQEPVELIDPGAVRDILSYTERISRTVFVFVRDDVTESDWQKIGPATRALVVLAHGNLKEKADRLRLIAGVAEEEYALRVTGDLRLIAEVSGAMQYVLTMGFNWAFVIDPAFAVEVATATIQALVSLIPLFQVMEGHFELHPERLQYFVGNVRGCLDRLDELLF